MQENPFTKRSHLSSASIRLGLSLALGVLTVLLLVGLVSVASPALAPAAPSGSGDLDTTFGTSGVVTTAIGPGDDYAGGVALQPDGKIVAAGYANNGSDRDFALVRYTVSGTLDTTFGSGGVVTTSIGPGHDAAGGVTLQPDGKIVAAGYANNGSDDDFVVVRYTISGDLDATFGSGGVVTTSIGPGHDAAADVAIQSDGKIVAVGHSDGGGSVNDFALVRYTISGTLDTTFGSGGVVTTPIGTGADWARGVAIQPDGKIVAAGRAQSGGYFDFALVRYTISGTLDTTFGSGGVVTTSIGPSHDGASDVAIQPDGKIVTVGYTDGGGSGNDFALVRYTISGDLDATFGTGGVVATPIGPGDDYAIGVAIQLDGKIVVAGNAHSGSDCDFALVRYAISGTLDTIFGTSGVVTTPIGTGDDSAADVAIQSDGKIVAAGYANNGSDRDFAVARYQVKIYSIYLPLMVRE